MIDAKQAVQIAKEKATEMLGQMLPNLEEIERDSYKDRDVWSITLSFPRDLDQVAPFLKLSADPLQYKRFLIDVQTGELLAMKLREVASR
jgi:Peptidase propeptide and YPEB domain